MLYAETTQCAVARSVGYMYIRATHDRVSRISSVIQTVISSDIPVVSGNPQSQTGGSKVDGEQRDYARSLKLHIKSLLMYFYQVT